MLLSSAPAARTCAICRRSGPWQTRGSRGPIAHAREVDPLSMSADQAALVPLAIFRQNDQGLEVAKNYSVSESVLRTRHGVSVSVIITDRIKASVLGCCGVDMTGWSVQIR